MPQDKVLTTDRHHRCGARLGGSAALLAVSLGPHGLGGAGLGNNIQSLWNLGWATVNPNLIIQNLPGESEQQLGTMESILLANTPQLVISLAYFCYNGLITCMLSAAEYSSYGVQRKPLRVTNPVGLQRSTYWLSIPFRYSVPFLIAFALLHWFVSQSIFYVLVIRYNVTSSSTYSIENGATINTCGYSPIAIIFAIGLGSLMVLTLPILGLRRFKSNIPVAGSCSAAISAACHPPMTNKEAAQKCVMWGEIVLENSLLGKVGFDSDVPGAHYSFTSQDIVTYSSPKP
jgi:hypothetical protein